MTRWQYVKAVGWPTWGALWAAGWAVYDLLFQTGWARAVLVPFFLLMVAFNVWWWPRSLRSYRRMVDSGRRLGEARMRLIGTMLRKGYPPEIVLRVDSMIQADMPPELVAAVMDAYRPPRRRPWPFSLN